VLCGSRFLECKFIVSGCGVAEGPLSAKWRSVERRVLFHEVNRAHLGCPFRCVCDARSGVCGWGGGGGFVREEHVAQSQCILVPQHNPCCPAALVARDSTALTTVCAVAACGEKRKHCDGHDGNECRKDNDPNDHWPSQVVA
jgi:hypothetical protein